MSNLPIIFMYVSLVVVLVGILAVMTGAVFGWFTSNWIIFWVSLAVTVIAFILLAILGTVSGEFEEMESIRRTEEASRPTPAPQPTKTPKPTQTSKPEPTEEARDYDPLDCLNKIGLDFRRKITEREGPITGFGIFSVIELGPETSPGLYHIEVEYDEGTAVGSLMAKGCKVVYIGTRPH